jgi:diguanylate cyclase (GGDEF)-like protein
MTATDGEPPRSPRPRRVPALVAGLALVAVATAWASTLLGDPAPARWPVLAGLLLVLTTSASLRLEFRRADEVVSVSPFEAAVAPAVFLFAGPVAIVLVAIAKALAETLLRIELRKAAFNVAQWAAAAGVGSLLFTVASSAAEPSWTDIPALFAALVGVSLVNHLAVVAVLALTEGSTVRRVAGSLRPLTSNGGLVGGAATISFGILFAVAADWAPVTIPLFVVPLLFLHWASERYAASVSDLEHLQGLQRATHALAATADPADALRRFVDEVRLAFGAEVAELNLDDTDLSTSYQSTERSPGHRIHHVAPAFCSRAADANGAPVKLTVESVDPATATAMRAGGWREVLVTRVVAGGSTGSLCVCNPRSPAGSTDADLAVLAALAREVAGAIERDRLLHAMLRSEGRFQALAQYSADLTVVIDERGVIQDDVPTSHPFQVPQGVGVGSHLTEIMHPDDLEIARSAFERLISRAFATETIECRLRAADGSWRDVEIIATNLLDDPAVEGVALTCRDITHRKQTATLLQYQSDVLQVIARGTDLPEVLSLLVSMLESQSPGSRGAILLTGPDGRLHPAVGTDLPPPVCHELGARLVDAPAELPLGAAPPATAEITGVLRPGEGGGGAAARGTLSAVRIDRDAEGRSGVVALLLDRPRPAEPHEWRLLELASRLAQLAQEHVGAQQRLVRQATQDHLTGLPNRVVFLDRTAVALARLERTRGGVAIVFVDLDRFKVVNDSLGHESGDQLLQTLGERLQEAMRVNDTVARFGGDEFTILCDDVADEAEVALIADRIKEVVAEPVSLRGHELTVTASLGIAHTTDPHTDPAALIDNADMAMYRAKIRGGNHIESFDPALRTRAMRELVTQSALRSSIDRGDLRVHYQPVVSLDSGRVVGVEALVRWEHPQLGLVPPDQFVPLAEQTGLIIPIGSFVLREACRQARRWQDTSPTEITTSVNLSARQFADPTLTATVADILESTGVKPSSINLEITETVLMDNAEATHATLQDLVDLGVHLTIDDFGTGYSSLSYLKRFPVGGLKIDRSFVSGLGDDADDSAIVAAVISLAHSLGMIAVAEGVETDEQRERLSDLGCDIAQGYLFSRPVTADALPLLGDFS